MAEPIGRDEAGDAAREELSRAAYRDDRSWLERIFDAIDDWFGDRSADLDQAASTRPVVVAILVVVLVVLLALAVAWRMGALQRNARGAGAVLEFEGRMSAAAHRALAEQLAAAGDWRSAVRERLRAIVRELEERTLIDERPGRTAGEIALEAGAALPAAALDLQLATRTFADIWYGEHEATAASDSLMRAVDERVRASARGRVAAG